MTAQSDRNKMHYGSQQIPESLAAGSIQPNALAFGHS